MVAGGSTAGGDNPGRIRKRAAGYGDKRAVGVHEEQLAELVDIFSLAGEKIAYQVRGNGQARATSRRLVAERDRAWPPGSAARERITRAGSRNALPVMATSARRRRAYGVAGGAGRHLRLGGRRGSIPGV